MITDSVNSIDNEVEIIKGNLENNEIQNNFVRQNTARPNFSNALSAREFKVKIPIFKGTGRPLEFLREIKKCFDRMHFEFSDAKLHFQQALQETAHSWYSLNKEKN